MRMELESVAALREQKGKNPYNRLQVLAQPNTSSPVSAKEDYQKKLITEGLIGTILGYLILFYQHISQKRSNPTTHEHTSTRTHEHTHTHIHEPFIYLYDYIYICPHHIYI